MGRGGAGATLEEGEQQRTRGTGYTHTHTPHSHLLVKNLLAKILKSKLNLGTPKMDNTTFFAGFGKKTKIQKIYTRACCYDA
jgi:hypothetical protein